MTSRLGSAQPDLGLGYELEAIAAVIIGGTSLLGGKGTISGTIIGALIMSVLINGLRILELQQEWQYVVVGIVFSLRSTEITYDVVAQVNRRINYLVKNPAWLIPCGVFYLKLFLLFERECY